MSQLYKCGAAEIKVKREREGASDMESRLTFSHWALHETQSKHTPPTVLLQMASLGNCSYPEEETICKWPPWLLLLSALLHDARCPLQLLPRGRLSWGQLLETLVPRSLLWCVSLKLPWSFTLQQYFKICQVWIVLVNGFSHPVIREVRHNTAPFWNI